MQEIRFAPPMLDHHDELLRRSEYARLAQAVSDRPASGLNIYRVIGQRLVDWGETLQRVNAHREAVAFADRRLRTGEIPGA